MSTKRRSKNGGTIDATWEKALCFREVAFGHDPALVFAPPDVAVEVDRIHRAIEQSKTWGEFRQRMPTRAYTELYAGRFSDDPEVLAEDPDLATPADGAPFSSSEVPGYCEGDYPLWIASVQERYVPLDLLRKHGTREDSSLNGSFWRVYSPHRDAILDALRARGYELSEREDLNFW